MYRGGAMPIRSESGNMADDASMVNAFSVMHVTKTRTHYPSSSNNSNICARAYIRNTPNPPFPGTGAFKHADSASDNTCETKSSKIRNDHQYNIRRRIEAFQYVPHGLITYSSLHTNTSNNSISIIVDTQSAKIAILHPNTMQLVEHTCGESCVSNVILLLNTPAASSAAL